MNEVPITLVMKDLDTVAPLACGDVPVQGVALHLDRDTPRALERPMSDPTVDAGELSLSRHVQRLDFGRPVLGGAAGLCYRGFRQRCFYVRRGSELNSLEQLRGKRVGSNEWPASGNVWTKALLREAGVALESITWYLGPVDDPAEPRRPQGTLPGVLPGDSAGPLPQRSAAGRQAGCPDGSPRPATSSTSPAATWSACLPTIGRWRASTTAGPASTRATTSSACGGASTMPTPGSLRSLYDALEESRLLWQRRRRVWAECTPWYLAELEEVTALMGEDWQPNGLAANRRMVDTFCRELHAQGLIAHPTDGAAVFSEFEEAAGHQPA